MPDHDRRARHDASAALASRAAELARRAGRPELHRRAAAAARRLSRMAAVAVVAGEYGAGKSSLVNTVAGADACPVDSLDATTVMTVVRHGPPSMAVRVADDPPGEVRSISDAARWLTDDGNPGNERGVDIADIAVRSEVLAEGIVLVDTPGTGGLHPGFVSALTDLIPTADALVLVVDSGAPLTPDALRMLTDAVSDGLEVVVALTKTDLHAEWRAMAAAATRAMRDVGIAAPVIPLALPLAPAADSGIAGLVSELRRRLVGPARSRLGKSALDTARVVATELASMAADPDVEQRRAAFTEGRRRWQAMLQEGFAEITVDLDGEVRAGLIRLGTGVDDVVASVDPGKDWGAVRSAVDDATALLVRSLGAHLTESRNRLAGEIAAALGAPGALDEDAIEVGAGIGSVDGEAPETTASSGAVSRGLDVLRGSYGGIMLVGVLGQLVALPVAAPIALGAGAVFGVRQMSDQRRRKVDQRRTSARRVARAHLDETGARLGSAVRKAVQAAQRDLRDGTERLIAELDSAASAGQDVTDDAGRLLADIREEGR